MLIPQSLSEEEEDDWIFAVPVADTTVGVDVAGGGGMGETEPDL